MTPGFVVLTQPVKVKIAYGETVLPAGMKLPVVSSDATSIRIKYMGELQTIPIGAARFEGPGPTRRTPALPRLRRFSDQAGGRSFHNAWYTATSFTPAGLRLPDARRRHQHARIAITFVVTLY